MTPTTTARLVLGIWTFNATSVVFQDSSMIYATFHLGYSPSAVGTGSLQLVDGANTSTSLPLIRVCAT